MKLRNLITAFALAVGLTTAAAAATPVAVWDGDFSKTIEGYTLDLNGNTAEGGVVTIASKGVKVTFASAMDNGVTVLYKYAGMTFGKEQALATVLSGSNGSKFGVELTSDNFPKGIYKDAAWGTAASTAFTTASGKLALTYKNGGGTYAYYLADGARTQIYGASGLHESGAKPSGVNVGGKHDGLPSAGTQISAIAVFDKVLTADEMSAYKFSSDVTTYTATLDDAFFDDWGSFEDIEWTPEKPGTGFTKNDNLVLTIDVTDYQYLNFNEGFTANKVSFKSESGTKPLEMNIEKDATLDVNTWDFTEAAGRVSVGAPDEVGTDLCKKAVVGVPYSYWVWRTDGEILGTENLFADNPSDSYSGYTYASETFSRHGVRIVTTAPAWAKFGSININFAGGRNSQAMVDGSKVGSLTTLIGAQPVLGTSWNDIGAENQEDTIVSKYVRTDGTVEEDAEITLTASQVANPYTSGAAANMLITGYMDDSQNPIVQISFIPFAKYRVILYRATDSGSMTFSAAQIGTTAEDAKIYYGPTSGDATGGTTLNGAAETVWGKSDWRTGYAEGVNYIVSDVLEGGTAYIYSHKHAGRAGVAAIQIVEVDQVTMPPISYTAEINESTFFSDIEWTPKKTIDFRDADTITLTVTDNATLTLNEDFTIGTLKVVSDEDVLLTLKKGEGVSANVGTFDITNAVEGVAFDATEGYNACPATLTALRTTDSKITFVGDGENGATLDYGTAWNNYTFAGHYVFDGGKHVFQNASEKASHRFGANATAENPTFWVQNGAELTFKSRNPCGYNDTTADADGIIRIGEDSSVVLQNSAAGTWYWSQQFYFEDNSTLAVQIPGDNFRIVGGDTEGAPQFYLPEGTAEISGLADNYLALPANGGSGVAFEVGEGATLTVTANLKSLADNKPFVKKGAGTLALSGDMSSFAPAFTVAGGTLQLDAGEGVFTNKFAMTNDGTIEVTGGTVVFKPGWNGTIVEDGGTAIFGYTVGINDCGEFALPAGRTADQVALFDAGGNPVAATFNETTQKFEFEWDIEGKNCWWDYEFDGTVASVGTDTTTMSREGTDPFYNAESNALWVGHATHYRGATYPTEFTAVFRGKMVNNQKHVEMGFGSTTGGTKINVAIACGDPAKEEVLLLVSNGFAVQKTVTMTVPNAYTADHLYAFTCKTVEGNTKVIVYLDGKEWDSYTFDGEVALGGGFQIGSVHGGVPTGYAKATTANESSFLDFLRVYNVALNDKAMKAYAEVYPYVSENGKAMRTFDDSLDQGWVAAEATAPWTQTLFGGESYATNCPLPTTVIEVEATAAAEVTMNLAEAANYEAFTVGEGAAIAFKAGEDAVTPTVAGLTSIGADVTVDYDAIRIGKVDVDAGKTLTFDFTDFPFGNYYVSTSIEFTGAVSGEGAIAATGLPTEGARTAAFGPNEFGHYALTITVAPVPFVYTIAGWKWDGQDVTAEAVSNNTALAVETEADLEWPMDRASFTVKGGTLKAASAPTVSCAVEVTGGAFDLNGIAPASGANNYAVTLAGGALVNSADTLGLVKSLTLTDNSTIDTSAGAIAIQSQHGGWGATTLALGDNTLTKTGTNRLEFVATTVSGAGTIDVQEGTLWTQENNDFGEAVVKLGETGVFEVRAGKKATVAKIESAEGGTVMVHGTISGFTLDGWAELTNEGAYGTITNMDRAVAYVGQKRDLTFAGAGTVNVTLTDGEYEAGQATLFTKAEDATVAIGTVMYNDEDITDKCTISGNQITAIQKIEPVEPGEEIDVPQGKTAAEFAADISTNDVEKAKYLVPPGGVETSFDYRKCFSAVPSGNNTVRFELNETGTNTVVEATVEANAAALNAVFSDEDTLSIDAPLVGFYYSFKQGGDVQSLDYLDPDADRNLIGGSDDVSFTIEKPEGAGFYQTIITPTSYDD